MESIFPSTVQSVITDELLYPSFVCSFIQVSYIRGLPFLIIVYIVITVSYIVLFQFRIQLFFLYRTHVDSSFYNCKGHPLKLCYLSGVVVLGCDKK